MPSPARVPVRLVLKQHAEDVASLRATRAVLVRAPHVKLHLLQRLDERLEAHLDGLDVAGDAGRDACVAALEAPTPGTAFAAAVVALTSRNSELLHRLLAMAEAEPQARSGIAAAFGWVSTTSLRGITKELLDSPHPFRREMGCRPARCIR